MNKRPSAHSTVFQGFVSPADVKRRREIIDPNVTSPPPSLPPVKLPGVGDLVGEHYILVSQLGEGAFAKVYLAQRDDVPEHHVAIKIFARAVYEGRNVERELVMLATVGHPNVVQLKDHGAETDYVWLTMPVYQGETLEERLERGTLSMNEAYEIFLSVARGMEALHAGGLRHQDIKPDNIFLALFGGRVHPILLDLGVAAECDSNFVAGTLMYAAPEQIAFLAAEPGDAVLSEKMDTYGVATTLLMALVGRDLLPGATAEGADDIKAAQKVRAESPLHDKALPDLKGRPRELFIAALKRWLALDPKERPSMSDLAEELDVLREPEREKARAEEQRRIRQKTSLLRVRVAALVLLLMGLGTGYYLYSKRTTLALAGQLEKAQREGAESFDKLDTCIASHAIEKSAAASCRASREKDRTEFDASLDAVKKSGSATAAERAQQIKELNAIFANRLRTCEDESKAALRRADEEKNRIASGCRDEKAELTREIDEQKKLVEARTRAVDICDEARHALLAERETWKAAQAAAPAAVPAPAGGGAPAAGSPAPAGSGAAAAGAVVTAGTGAAATAPPPPPPPATAAPPPPQPKVDPTDI